MKTTTLSIDRNAGHQNTVVSRGGRRIKHDVRLIVDESMTREQVLLTLDKLKMRMLEIPWPPASA